MRIRTEVEITCQEEGCKNTEWALTTFELNDSVRVESVPGNIDVVEEYTTESVPPAGWGMVTRISPARKSKYGNSAAFDYTEIICNTCLGLPKNQ